MSSSPTSCIDETAIGLDTEDKVPTPPVSMTSDVVVVTMTEGPDRSSVAPSEAMTTSMSTMMIISETSSSTNELTVAEAADAEAETVAETAPEAEDDAKGTFSAHRDRLPGETTPQYYERQRQLIRDWARGMILKYPEDEDSIIQDTDGLLGRIDAIELKLVRTEETLAVQTVVDDSKGRIQQQMRRQCEALEREIEALKAESQQLQARIDRSCRILNSRKYRRRMGGTVPPALLPAVQWANERDATPGFTDDVMGWWKIPLVLQQAINRGPQGIQEFVNQYNKTKKRVDKLPVNVQQHSYFVCLCGASCNQDGHLKKPFVVAFPVGDETNDDDGDNNNGYAPGFARYDVLLPDKARHAVIRHLRKVQADVVHVPPAIALRAPWVVSEELQHYMDQDQAGLEAYFLATLGKVSKTWSKYTYLVCQCEVCNNNDLENAIVAKFMPTATNGFVAGSFADYNTPLPPRTRQNLREHVKHVGGDLSMVPLALKND